MPKVTLIDTNEVFEIPQDAILHDALDTLGYKLPHGCLAGSCGACRIETVNPEGLHPAGAVEQNTIDALNDERVSKGLPTLAIRLSCRAKVVSDVAIKLIKD